MKIEKISVDIVSYSREAPSEKINRDACVICHLSDHDKSNPLQDVKNGIENLLTFCEKFDHIDLKQHLLKEQQLPHNVKKIKIHKTCQRNVCNQNKKRFAAKASLPDDKNKPKILRSSMQMFDWKANCMFCGKTCQKNVKHPDRKNCHEVTTLSLIKMTKSAKK